ncbi:MAG: tryptophan synthase subunit alpha [Oscillospiraceae bacterium]|nr:tryptophan synthase subunit alpha [Oscillospiraceae bacterium]
MNKITSAFENNKALITFVTGGDPDMETTEKLVLAMEEAGADIIEIGIPFSDPVAEGPVIQKSSARALAGGCTTDKLFAMAANLRKKTNVPLVFMTYANPIYVYKKDRFMAKCSETGIDGIIVPDVPFEEKGEFAGECKKHGISVISLIAPTSGERAEKIAKGAEGFLYCVSSLGVTGARGEIESNISELIREVRKHSAVPCAVGFGISTPKQAREMADISDGAIIGSAIVDLVAEHGRDSVGAVKSFVKELKGILR